MSRLKIIGVMGDGSESHLEFSRPLGKWVAESGFHLLTGGGLGVMEAVSRAFNETENRIGLSIGIIPGEVKANHYESLPSYPNQWIEVPIYTHLPFIGEKGTSSLSRNHINILSADFIVVLQGGYGTASEVELAIKYKKPIAGFYDEFQLLEEKELKIPEFDKLSELTKYILKTS